MKKELYKTRVGAWRAAHEYARKVDGYVAGWISSTMDASGAIDFSELDNYGGEYEAWEVVLEDGTTVAFFGWNEE